MPQMKETILLWVADRFQSSRLLPAVYYLLRGTDIAVDETAKPWDVVSTAAVERSRLEYAVVRAVYYFGGDFGIDRHQPAKLIDNARRLDCAPNLRMLLSILHWRKPENITTFAFPMTNIAA